MSTASVLGASFEGRPRPQASASTMRCGQCVLAVMLLVLSAFYVAQPVVAEVSAGREVSITGDRTKQQFLAGYRVHIGANVTDDVFAVGREVTIDSDRDQRLLAQISTTPLGRQLRAAAECEAQPVAPADDVGAAVETCAHRVVERAPGCCALVAVVPLGGIDAEALDPTQETGRRRRRTPQHRRHPSVLHQAR